jgi:hypothetical protein
MTKLPQEFLDGLAKFVADFRAWVNSQKRPEEPLKPPDVPKPTPPPIHAPEAQITPSERLYKAAYLALGTEVTPKDEVPDSFACAQVFSEIYYRAFGERLGVNNENSTYWIRYFFGKSVSWEKIDTPVRGCAVISATGFQTRRNPDRTYVIPNGHLGIYMGDEKIAANDSSDGFFKITYTLDSWAERYVKIGGFPQEYFRPI